MISTSNTPRTLWAQLFRHWPSITCSVVAILVVLGLIETVFRTTHVFNSRVSWSEPDPLVGYRSAPGHRYWVFEENDHPITGRFNRFGWRDRERTKEKPAGVYRIAIIGDSFVESLQVETERTFISLLETQLDNDLEQPVEVLSFGRSGYSQAEEYLVLQHDAMAFAPDVVVLVFVPYNDIADIRRETVHEALRPFYTVSDTGELLLDLSYVESRGFKIRQAVSGLKRRSALISFLGERYNGWRARRMLNAHREAWPHRMGAHVEMPGYVTLMTDQPDPEYVDSYRMNKVLIKAMAHLCQSQGVRFMLVTVDNSPDIREHERAWLQADPTFQPNFFEDDLRVFAHSIGADYLGLNRLFQAAIDRGSTLHWNHWNYAGHQLIAEVLGDVLKTTLHNTR